MKLTPKEFLDYEIANGIGPHNPKFVDLAKKTVNQLTEYKKLSMIDYGAGTGVYADVLLKEGFDVTACDIDKTHRDFMKSNYPDLKVVAKPKQSDFMIYIEVAEHMTDEQIVKAVNAINPSKILFSSTSQKTDHDEAWGHINVKPQEEWLEFWAELGFKKINDLSYPTKWTILLQKT